MSENVAVVTDLGGKFLQTPEGLRCALYFTES